MNGKLVYNTIRKMNQVIRPGVLGFKVDRDGIYLLIENGDRRIHLKVGSKPSIERGAYILGDTHSSGHLTYDEYNTIKRGLKLLTEEENDISFTGQGMLNIGTFSFPAKHIPQIKYNNVLEKEVSIDDGELKLFSILGLM